MSSPYFRRLLSLPPVLRAHAFKQIVASNGRLNPSPAFRLYTPSHTASPSPSSVNSSEVSHFSALASTWWDPHGSSRLLHLMNPLRHDFIKRCLNSHVRPSNAPPLQYLDVGCGGGIFAESAARMPDTGSVTAIDPTKEVIAVAERHARQDPLLLPTAGKLKYHNTTVEDLPKSGEGFDVVTLFEVVEHIRQPSPFLRSCLEHLKPGGWLIGSTIARTNVSWLTTKLIAEDVLRLVPRGTHEWNQYIQPTELRDWARGEPGLDVEGQGWQVMGVVYVPGLGWKEVPASEDWGNYFFGIRKTDVKQTI